MNFRKALKEKAFSNDFRNVFKNMLILAVGAGFAKAIGMASIPILTRMYEPSDFGVLAVFTSFLILLAPLSTLSYSVAIPLPKSDRLAINLMALSLLLIALTTFFLGIFLWNFHSWIFSRLSIQIAQPYWWLIVFGVGALSVYESLSLWGTRKKAFKVVASSQAIQALVGATIKISLGWLGLKPLGLMVGQVFQQSGGAIYLCKYFYLSLHSNFKDVNRRLIIKCFFLYFNFLKYKLPANVLFVVASQAPILFSSMLYGKELTGQLGLAIMSISLPLSLMAQSMSKAYYAEISSLGRRRNKEILSLTKLIVFRMFFFATPVFVILLLWGDIIFSIIFGSNWMVAGELASILSICLVFQFVASPIIVALNVFGAQHKALYIHMGRTFLTVSVFVFSWMLEVQFYWAIAIYSVCLSVHYIYTTFLVLSIIKKGSLSISNG